MCFLDRWNVCRTVNVLVGPMEIFNEPGWPAVCRTMNLLVGQMEIAPPPHTWYPLSLSLHLILTACPDGGWDPVWMDLFVVMNELGRDQPPRPPHGALLRAPAPSCEAPGRSTASDIKTERRTSSLPLCGTAIQTVLPFPRIYVCSYPPLTLFLSSPPPHTC